MEIRAYHELYLPNAMTTMATMLDYAVNVCHEDLDTFFSAFTWSPVSTQFEQGSPMVITGKTGVELYRMVRFKYFGVLPDYIAMDRSPEYWVGWSLAYYQWFSNRTFREIVAVVPLSEMRAWYPTLHEADRMRFVEELDRRLMQRPTNLEILRKRANLSQTDLANLSGVSLRSIQMYEQRRNDITKAQFNILNALAKVLGCNIYDLMDSDTTLYPSNPPARNDFTLAFYEQMRKNQEARERLLQEQKMLQDQLNAYRYGYMNQLPCQPPYGRGCYIQSQQFVQNWDQYWTNILNQQAIAENIRHRAQEESQRIARKLIKEATGQAVDAIGNPAASLAYDSMCLLTTENLFEATEKVIKVIQDIMQMGRRG